ncbi:hypothetical protein FJZ31_32500 [Candidatus Poribacteria bacterium]|nr:hypothetical protein [Candidatus Poribacteria bacterium]
MSVLWIIGEAKSGKSELAEEFFARFPGKKFYIGTLPRILRWMDTIKKHADRRPKDWQLIEITDKLDVATELIRQSRKNEMIAVLLDGYGVYVGQRTLQWDNENTNVTMVDETRFVDEIYREYRELVNVCHYLIVVDHISAQAPTIVDYELDRIAWRMRAVVSRCIAEADKVIYHDVEDVSHKDRSYVERIAGEMIAFG